jgi:ABC-type proline/glycine betaine transport system permease subunit
MIGSIVTLIGVKIALVGVLIGLKQLKNVNLNVKRSCSPILLAGPSKIGSEPAIKFTEAFGQYPVVQNVSFNLRNVGSRKEEMANWLGKIPLEV